MKLWTFLVLALLAQARAEPVELHLRYLSLTQTAQNRLGIHLCGGLGSLPIERRAILEQNSYGKAEPFTPAETLGVAVQAFARSPFVIERTLSLIEQNQEARILCDSVCRVESGTRIEYRFFDLADSVNRRGELVQVPVGFAFALAPTVDSSGFLQTNLQWEQVYTLPTVVDRRRDESSLRMRSGATICASLFAPEEEIEQARSHTSRACYLPEKGESLTLLVQLSRVSP